MQSGHAGGVRGPSAHNQGRRIYKRLHASRLQTPRPRSQGAGTEREAGLRRKDGLATAFIFIMLYMLTAFFCTFLHVSAFFCTLAHLRKLRAGGVPYLCHVGGKGRPTGRLPCKGEDVCDFGPPRGEGRRPRTGQASPLKAGRRARRRLKGAR